MQKRIAGDAKWWCERQSPRWTMVHRGLCAVVVLFASGHWWWRRSWLKGEVLRLILRGLEGDGAVLKHEAGCGGGDAGRCGDRGRRNICGVDACGPCGGSIGKGADRDDDRGACDGREQDRMGDDARDLDGGNGRGCWCAGAGASAVDDDAGALIAEVDVGLGGAEGEHEGVEDVAEIVVGLLEEILELCREDLLGDLCRTWAGNERFVGGHGGLPCGKGCGEDAIVCKGHTVVDNDLIAVLAESNDGVVLDLLYIPFGVVELCREGVV